MKRLAYILTVLLAVAGVAIQAIPARADSAQTDRQEFFYIVGDPANAEPVQVSGEFHAVVKETDLHDGTVRTEVRLTAHGTGVGLWSGTPYRFNETYTYSWIDPAGLEYTATSHDVMRLISLGASPNARITQNMEVARDAYGQYTFQFSLDYDITGRGS